MYRKIVLIFNVFLFGVVSCNSKNDENKQIVIEENMVESKILYHNFPDTVKLNQIVDGSIQYDVENIEYDSKLISSRFLELILSTNINKELANYKDIDNNRLLSYVDSLNTGKFNFKAVFKNKGKQTLNIAIRDNMFLKPDKNIPSDKITLRRSDCLFSKEVYVID